jgi:FAD/FMN-containing dehydrogenase
MLDLSEKLAAVVGDGNVFTGDAIDERYRIDTMRKYPRTPGYVLRPKTTEQIAEIVKLASQTGTPITASGGRTGAVGATCGDDGGIILSLELMNKIIEIDPASMTMTVEAGATLQSVHEAAEAQGLLMPLDLGARGSATIGGNISTNAGGVRVLRWGMMRDMVLGMEAVLANGTIVSSLGKFIKDNAGYNWKHLLIGSEGSLGIVTKAVLRLRPLPRSTQTALVAFSSFDDAIRLLRMLDAQLGGQMSSFELMWNSFYSLMSETQRAKRQPPLPQTWPVYALIERMGNDPERDEAGFQEALAGAIEAGVIADAVIAQSERERANLWALRDDLVDAFMPMWPFFAMDMSMAQADMAAFVAETEAGISKHWPDGKIFHFGHAGDGNLHVNVCVGKGDHDTEQLVDDIVYGALAKVKGSIAAELGVGREKQPFIGITRSPEEIELMRTIKKAMDPKNILNPGIIMPVA